MRAKIDTFGALIGRRKCQIWLVRFEANHVSGLLAMALYYHDMTGLDGWWTVALRLKNSGARKFIADDRDVISKCVSNGSSRADASGNVLLGAFRKRLPRRLRSAFPAIPES